ncbi:MAG: hypothetical protein V4724_11555 [Pseudomonadota bacterium]
MKIVALTALLSVLAIAQPAVAASKSASFQATFVVLESCTVESGAKPTEGAPKPAVRCQFASPYKLVQQPVAVQAPAAQAPQQTVPDDGQSKIWTVTF